MDIPIQVRQRGRLTLPADVRSRYNIKEGDTYYLDLDGIFVPAPMVPLVHERAREIERLRLGAGLSTAELLEGLGEQRAKYWVEG